MNSDDAALRERHVCARRFGLLLLLAVLCAFGQTACFAGRQWYINFTTSASIPRMADRLRIEVLDSSGRPACDDCVRDIDLTSGRAAENLQSGLLSIGVADSENAVRIRARLYRAASPDNTGRSIDVVGKLPPFIDLPGEVEFKIFTFELPFTCFGRPPELAAGTTCQLDAGGRAVDGPEPTLPEDTDLVLVPYGSASTCTKAVPEGMACVGAGAFIIGDERYEALAYDYPSGPEVVKAIDPAAALMIDIDEVTVGTFRKLMKQGTITALASGPRGLVPKSAAGDTAEAACTYLGVDDVANDALPLNCVGRDLASEVCAALGRRLPSEMEWEFAAANGVEETIYPWGNLENAAFEGIFRYDDDEVVCKRAVVGRGRKRIAGESSACANGRGPIAGGSARDISHAGVKNLGGNLSEWVSDAFGFYDESCWAAFDGRCTEPSARLTTQVIPHRGGSWARSPQSAVAIARFARPDGPSPYVGFRCAVSEDELP